MKVHGIGAGPGDIDLITVRGRDLLACCPLCLFADSIVPREVLAYYPPNARTVETAPMSLDEIEAEHASAKVQIRAPRGCIQVICRYGARWPSRCGGWIGSSIDYTMTPGVLSFAAAALGRELTIPGGVQSLVLTRVSGRASAMPAGETLASFGQISATPAIHLAINAFDHIVAELTRLYGGDCPIAIAQAEVAKALIDRTALIVVEPALIPQAFRASALYHTYHQRRFRGRDAS